MDKDKTPSNSEDYLAKFCEKARNKETARNTKT
jgi:hypothetical protein